MTDTTPDGHRSAPGWNLTPTWRSDRRWIWYFALLVLGFTTLPYLLGYARQGENWRYSGFLFGVEDGNSYIAKMLRGGQGEWLFRTPYSPFPQRGIFMYFPYLLLGKLTAPPGQHEQLVALFHLFRLAGGIALVFSTYAFVAIFIHERTWRRVGTALIILGGGMGWLVVIGAGSLWGGDLPLDFYSPEAFGFLMVFGLPHLAAARALSLWGLRNYLIHSDQKFTLRNALKTGLIWMGVWLLQPINIIITWGVVGAHLVLAWLWQTRRGGSAEWLKWRQYLKHGLGICMSSAPLVLYTFLSFRFDPSLGNWEVQNQLHSPPIHHYLLAYALLLLPAVLGVGLSLRKIPWTASLIVAWAVLAPILVYLPVSIQRRLIEGSWIAIVILALFWIENQKKAVRKWAPAWLSLSFLTTVVIYLGSLTMVWNPRMPLYRPAQEIEIFNFLAENAGENEVVLASFESSNSLPAWAAVRLVTGHGPEGYASAEMREVVGRFYGSGMNEAERAVFLREFGVDYVLWGPAERSQGDWDPRQTAYLAPAIEIGPYLLLRQNSLP